MIEPFTFLTWNVIDRLITFVLAWGPAALATPPQANVPAAPRRSKRNGIRDVVRMPWTPVERSRP
jgi:hypothetical protein